MIKFRFKLFILSALLLTLSSGLLFYKNLFLSELNTNKGKNNFEELRYLDLKINEQLSNERRHLELHNEESSLDLELAKNKIHDLISIVMDLHQKDIAIKSSIKNIESYFNEKEEAIKKFQEAIKELREVANSLNPLFRDIQKKNIKFTLDKRDFYRECITDAFFYLSAPSKINLQQLLEDKKILSQIIGIAKAPEPTIQAYYDAIEKTIVLNTQIDEIILKNKQKSIDEDMNFVGTYFRDSSRSQSEQGQSFLILVFIAIIFYIISIIIILRKF
jgi:hypothetical protein